MIKDAVLLKPVPELIAAHDALGDSVRATGEDFALLLAQYLDARAEYPDHMLAFGVAGFYAFFFKDAEIASETVGLSLRRGKHSGTEIPLCGVKREWANDHVQGLVAAGYGVAIGEEIETPAEARKRGEIVARRQLVRLITPGHDADLYSPPRTLRDKRRDDLSASMTAIRPVSD